MQLHPRVTRRTVDFVRKFEGFRANAAPVGEGWTLGYGHTATARRGAAVSRADAEILLAYDLARTAAAIEPLIYAPLEPNAFDALVSFAFSIGVEAFRRSEVRRRLNKGAPLQAAAALELWRRAELQGELQVVDALVRRRAAEKALFLTPACGFPSAPSPVVRSRLDARLLEAATRLAADDAATAAVVAQPPAIEINAPLDGVQVEAHGVGREPDARGRVGLRAEVIDALAERLDRVLETPPPAPPATPETLAERLDRVLNPPAAPAQARDLRRSQDIPPPPLAVERRSIGSSPPGGSGAEPESPPMMHDRAGDGVKSSHANPLAWLQRTGMYLAIFLLGLGLFLIAAVCIIDRRSDSWRLDCSAFWPWRRRPWGSWLGGGGERAPSPMSRVLGRG